MWAREQVHALLELGAVNVRQLVLVLVPVRATESFLWPPPGQSLSTRFSRPRSARPQAASQDPEDVVERNASQAQGGSAAKPEDWAAVSRCQ